MFIFLIGPDKIELNWFENQVQACKWARCLRFWRSIAQWKTLLYKERWVLQCRVFITNIIFISIFSYLHRFKFLELIIRCILQSDLKLITCIGTPTKRPGGSEKVWQTINPRWRCRNPQHWNVLQIRWVLMIVKGIGNERMQSGGGEMIIPPLLDAVSSFMMCHF